MSESKVGFDGISKLKPSSYGRGGFEVSISYTGFRKSKGEFLLCPKF